MKFLENYCGTLFVLLVICVMLMVGYTRYHFVGDGHKTTYERCVIKAKSMRNEIEEKEFTRSVCNYLPVEAADLRQ